MDHEWGPYSRHHGEKVQGQGNVSLPWLQCTHHDHIEKTGKDSVGCGTIIRNREKNKKKEINQGSTTHILTNFCKKESNSGFRSTRGE